MRNWFRHLRGLDPIRLTSVEREDRFATWFSFAVIAGLYAVMCVAMVTSAQAAGKAELPKPGARIEVFSNCSAVGPLLGSAIGIQAGPCYGEVWEVLDVREKDGQVLIAYRVHKGTQRVYLEYLNGKAWADYVEPEAGPAHHHGPVPPAVPDVILGV